MTDHQFHDGIYHAARRNYRDCPRSWHIPSESRRRGWFIWLGCQLAVCAIPVILIAMVWS